MGKTASGAWVTCSSELSRWPVGPVMRPGEGRIKSCRSNAHERQGREAEGERLSVYGNPEGTGRAGSFSGGE